MSSSPFVLPGHAMVYEPILGCADIKFEISLFAQIAYNYLYIYSAQHENSN